MQYKLEPPLRWVGDKRWLVPHLQPLWEPHQCRRLVEPFCGGLYTALGLLPARALLNDSNPHLINFYRWLKKGLVLSLPIRNDIHVYYTYREHFNRLLAQGNRDTKRAAELFYYFNCTGYEGMCRFNAQGQFNVPFGGYTRIKYQTDFTAYREVFENWQFITGHFQDIPLEPSDFVYADPPHGIELTQEVGKVFDWEDQQRLAKWLAQHRGPVVLCNEAADPIIELYAGLGFSVSILEGPPSSRSGGEKTSAREALAIRGV